MYRNLMRSLRLWLAPAAIWIATVAPASAQEMFGGWAGSCGLECGTTLGCQSHHCPPPLQHCQERPPVIRVKCGCPKPICNPCNQPNWGYYETCWTPWPFEPNYNHCLVVPPAATIALSGPHNPSTPYYGPNGQNQGQGQGGQYRQPPLPVEPSMPPVTAPPIPTTPVMPRFGGNPGQPQPNFQPMPGGGIDSLPVPRPETPRPELPPRPLPNPGGAF
jgi:hypothetical protein